MKVSRLSAYVAIMQVYKYFLIFFNFYTFFSSKLFFLQVMFTDHKNEVSYL